MEKFTAVHGYKGLYIISDKGVIKTIERVIIRSDGRKRTIKAKTKKPSINNGYYRISLVDVNGVSKSHYVHRLVISSFKKHSDLYVDHIDGNRLNNDLGNLRYATNSSNLTFRNTEKEYSTPYCYIYYDKSRNKYQVYKGKRHETIQQALKERECLHGLRP